MSDFQPNLQLYKSTSSNEFSLNIDFTVGGITYLKPTTVDNGVVNGTRHFEVKLDRDMNYNNGGTISESYANFTFGSEERYDVNVMQSTASGYVLKGSAGGTKEEYEEN